MQKKRLEGRVAIITGGGHGIGKAYARRLAEEGAGVVIAEIDAAAAERVAADLGGAGHAALALRTDVSDATSVGEMARRTVERFGRIDVLINNAGGGLYVPTADTPLEEARRTSRSSSWSMRFPAAARSSRPCGRRWSGWSVWGRSGCSWSSSPAIC